MDDHADDLLRRALIDQDAAAAVALRVGGLPLCDALTIVFHGRRDLGTIQTYITHGQRGAGSAVGPDELLRVPCDLDLASARDRDEAEELYAEQAGALRDALEAADTVLAVWQEPFEDLAGTRGAVDRRPEVGVRPPGPPRARARRPPARPPAVAGRAGRAREADRGDRRLQRPPARRGPPADGDRVRAAGRGARLPAARRPRALPRGLPRARRGARAPRRRAPRAA